MVERKLTRKKAEHERMSVCVPGIQGEMTVEEKAHQHLAQLSQKQ